MTTPPSPASSSATPEHRLISAHEAERVAGAVYGTIVATAVVASAAGPAIDPDHLIGLLLVTSVVFWMAHVYSRVVAESMQLGRRVTRREQVALAAQQWPMLQSAVPLVLALIPGRVGWISVSASLWLAVGVGLAALVVWGLRIGQLEGRGRLNVVRNALVTASFGLAIVLMKAWISH